MRTVWITLALALAAIAAHAQTARFSEVGLRQMALTSTTPMYPVSSVKAGVSGIAVADLISATPGGAPSIEILEAPDQAIGDAVREALGKWTFPVLRWPLHAKLTFYFRIEQGKGRVLNPQEMPGGPIVKPRPTYTPENPPPVAKPPTQSAVRELREADATQMTFDELQKLTGSNRPTILDVGDRAAFKRGHLDGAINIPYDELEVRAGIELRGRGRIVIDCTQEQTFHCLFADHVLKDAGFKDVVILRR